ncbi:MAG: methyltransferase domain-containing protein [Gammaproteobacteria bacterium]|nr:methyltransferase domain-containing protein [Gammaproteobacteria bacterium]
MAVLDYSHLSDDYDAKRYLSDTDRLVESLRMEAFMELLQLRSNMKVADIATGTGRGAIAMAAHVEHVTAVDGTPKMLEQAKTKAVEAGLSNIDFQLADAFALELPSEHFDLVIALNFLHLFLPVERQAKLVAQMARLVKPGGRLVIELDNALQGGPLGLLRKYFVHDLGYNFPWDIRRMMSPDLRIESVCGVLLPGVWRLHTLAPRLVFALARAAHYTPLLKYLTMRWFISARKVH